MIDPMGLTCPGCHQPPLLVFYQQAFCGNDDCRVFTWNPTDTLDEFLEGMKVINLDTEGGQ